MNHGLSDQVRELALQKYIHPALLAGKERISVSVRDLMQDLQRKGFPARNWPQICTAIQTDRFLRTNGLVIESVEGPPSKLSTTVVVRYKLASAKPPSAAHEPPGETQIERRDENETPEEWANRVTGKIRGLLKNEIAQFGGAEGFIRWVRSEDGDVE